MNSKGPRAAEPTPTGSQLSCKGWGQEAALRMFLNNLDPDVAERPQDLVVYGGTGKAARDWAAYDGIIGPQGVELIRTAYERSYTGLFGRTIPERDIEILSWSIVVSTRQEAAERVAPPCMAVQAPQAGTRNVILPKDRAYRDLPVYWRPDMPVGAAFDGPALVAEPQTTTFVTAGFRGRIDQNANLVLEKV